MQSNGISDENLLTMTAALLHDIGHGAYSHTFEGLFGTDHEKMTQLIITSPETEVNQILLQVAPDFPNRVASVIDHTYPNKQVVQLISSQIDVDRMDYLLRMPIYRASYGKFDLTVFCASFDRLKNGIAFQQNWHACCRGLRGQPLPNVYAGLLPPGYSCHGSPPSKSTQTR